MMPKSDTIEAIVRINSTAKPTFLAGFSNRELDEYLHRLCQVPKAALPYAQARPHQAQLVAAIAPQRSA